MSNKYCVNCEEQIVSDLSGNVFDDFCSHSCADAYAKNADATILDQVSKQNPDMITVSVTNEFGRERTVSGILPPNSIDAITALLQTSDSQKLKHAIDESVKNIQSDDSAPE